jgi:hypothetical protein
MNFNTVDTKIEQNNSIEKISTRTAYHQAGYAAAIYLGNQQKQLPPIHFQISIKSQTQNETSSNSLAGIVAGIFSQYAVKVEGGLLIQNIPLCFSQALQNLSWHQQAEYRRAFEADVTNILAGSLAEAKYIALLDDEAFNANLVHFKALHFYNGSTDIELISKYLDCYLPNETEREQKLMELFLAAFKFIDDKNNWQKISHLAVHIQRQTKPRIIHCEEAISILESDMPLTKTHSSDLQRMEYV